MLIYTYSEMLYYALAQMWTFVEFLNSIWRVINNSLFTLPMIVPVAVRIA